MDILPDDGRADFALFSAFSRSTKTIKDAILSPDPAPAISAISFDAATKTRIKTTLLQALLNYQITEFFVNAIFTEAGDGPLTISKGILKTTMKDECEKISTLFKQPSQFTTILEDDGPFTLDELYELFEYLWYSAICYYKVFDLFLGPLSAYKDIVTGDRNLCEFVSDFVEELKPLRERTERLINNFYQKLAILRRLPEKWPSRYTLQIEPSEINVYGKMILNFRLPGGDEEGTGDFLDYFLEGKLNIEKLKAMESSGEGSEHPEKWWE
jgi:hypothetical protein